MGLLLWGHYPVYSIEFMSYIEAESQNIRFWSFQKGNFDGGHTTQYYFDRYGPAAVGYDCGAGVPVYGHARAGSAQQLVICRPFLL